MIIPKQVLKKIAIELRGKTTPQLEESRNRYQEKINKFNETLTDPNNEIEIFAIKQKLALINQELERRNVNISVI